MKAEIMKIPYNDLQAELLRRFPGVAPKTLEERSKGLFHCSLEDLMIAVEYCRRNMRWGRPEDELTTYEDAMKNLYLPELLQRLELFQQTRSKPDETT